MAPEIIRWNKYHLSTVLLKSKLTVTCVLILDSRNFQESRVESRNTMSLSLDWCRCGFVNTLWEEGERGHFECWSIKIIILMIVLHSKQFSNSDMLKEIPQIMFHKHLWTISADQIWITFVLICIRWLMMAHYNCFKGNSVCAYKNHVSTGSVSNQYKNYLQLGFRKLLLCNFSFHFLSC